MSNLELTNFNFKEFNEVLNSCTGDVFLVSDEGDRLNLKSRLCQLIGFTKLIEGAKVSNVTLECSNPSDRLKFTRFNLFD